MATKARGQITISYIEADTYYHIDAFKRAVNAVEETMSGFSFDDNTAVALDDNEPIAAITEGSTVVAYRYEGTERSTLGMLVCKIDDADGFVYNDGEDIFVTPSYKAIHFYWYSDEYETKLLNAIEIPVVHDGSNGQEGLSTWTIYHEGTDKPTVPAAGQAITVNGWQEELTDNTIWMTQKRGKSLTEGKWGGVIRLRGEDGTSVKIQGNVDTGDALNAIANPVFGDAYLVNADRHLYVYKGDGWQDVGEFQGKAGDNAYVHIKYSNDGGQTLTSNNGEDIGTWMGIYTDKTQADSSDPTKYKWSKIKGVSITKVEEQYALNANKNTAPQTGWGTTVKDMTKSEPYLWNREVVYLDGVAQTPSTPQLIGMYVEDGVGVESVTEYYLVTQHATDVTTSSGGWSTDTKHVSKEEPYLWNYEAVRLTNGTVQKSSPQLIGTYSKDGVSVTETIEYYLISDKKEGVEISGNTWLKVVPTLTDDQPYLWNYTETKFSDGESSYSPPACIGSKGLNAKYIQVDKETIKFEGAELNVLSYDDDGAMLLDGDSIAEMSADNYIVHAWRRNGTEYSTEGYFYYVKNDSGVRVALGNNEGVTMERTDTKVTFHWVKSNVDDTPIAPSKSVYVVTNGQSLFRSYMFKRSSDKPTSANWLSAEGSYSNPNPTNTKGWSDGIPSTPANQPVWMQSRLFTNDGASPQQSSWTEPILMADSDTIDVCFFPYNNGVQPSNPTTHGVQGTNTNAWHDQGNENDYWMATSIKSAGEWGAWSIVKIKGEAGQTKYTWIKYADDANGGGLSDSPIGKKYIGFAYNKDSAEESTTASDYSWTLIKGTDGKDGANGKNGIDGAKGADGKTYYTWIKYSNYANGYNSTTPAMFDTPDDNTLYIGIAVNKESMTESDNPSDYSWSKFKGDQGVAGMNVKQIVVDRETVKFAGEEVNTLSLDDNTAMLLDGDSSTEVSGENYVVRAYRQFGLEASTEGYFYYILDDNGVKHALANNEGVTLTRSNTKVAFYWVKSSSDDTPIAPSKSVYVVKDGDIPYIDSTTHNWVINGQDSGFSAIGDDGHSPYISENTNTWWEYDPEHPNAQVEGEREGYQNTGIVPKGDKGDTGDQGDKGDKGDTGADGKNAIFADLDNETDSMLYAGDGTTKITTSVTSHASLYDGGVKVTDGITWSRKTSSGCSSSVTAAGLITVTTMSANDGYVIAKTTYKEQEYTVKFTLKKLVGVDKYDIQLSTDAIVYNSTTKKFSNGSTSMNIEVGVYRTQQNSARTLLAELPNNNYKILLNGNATPITYSESKAEIAVSKDTTSYKIELLDPNNVVLDSETVGLTVISDGAKGDKGDDGTSVKIVGHVANKDSLPKSYSGSVGDGYITDDDGHLHSWNGTVWVDCGVIKGDKGDQGDKGDNGITPTIGANGNWYLGDTDTGKPSRGGVGATGAQGAMLVPKGTWNAGDNKAFELKRNASSIEYAIYINGSSRYVVFAKEQTQSSPSSSDNPYVTVSGGVTTIKYNGNPTTATEYYEHKSIDKVVATDVLLANSGNIDVLDAGTLRVKLSNSDDGWEMKNGYIKHTGSGLELTSAGKLSIPNGALSFKVGSNDYVPEIKGDNLIPNAYFDKIAGNINLSSGSKKIFNSKPTNNAGTVAIGTIGSSYESNYGGRSVEITAKASSTAYGSVDTGGTYKADIYTKDVLLNTLGKRIKLEPNTKYTVSLKVKRVSGTVNTNSSYYFLYSDESTDTTLHNGHFNTIGIYSLNNDTEWHTCSRTFQTGSTYVYFDFRLGVIAGSTSSTEVSAKILIDAIKLEKGEVVTDMCENAVSNLLATGIDIENRKITLTADNFICQNNKLEKTMSLDKKGNLKVMGAIMNSVQTICPVGTNKENEHLLIPFYVNGSADGANNGSCSGVTNKPSSTSLVYCLDVWKCANVVKMNKVNHNVYLPFFMYAEGEDGNTSCEMRTFRLNDDCSTARIITKDDLLELVGKKLVVYGTTASSSYTNYLFYGVAMPTDTGDGIYSIHRGTSMSGIQINTTTITILEFRHGLVECTVGGQTAKYECFFWYGCNGDAQDIWE